MKQDQKHKEFMKKWGMSISLGLLIPTIVFTIMAIFIKTQAVYLTSIALAVLCFIASMIFQYLYKQATIRPKEEEKKEETPIPTKEQLPEEITSQPIVLESKKEEAKEEPVVEEETKEEKNTNTKKAILQYDDFDNLIKRYESITEAERITGINAKSLRDCCNGRQKHAGGYVWKFDEEDY